MRTQKNRKDVRYFLNLPWMIFLFFATSAMDTAVNQQNKKQVFNPATLITLATRKVQDCLKIKPQFINIFSFPKEISKVIGLAIIEPWANLTPELKSQFASLIAANPDETKEIIFDKNVLMYEMLCHGVSLEIKLGFIKTFKQSNFILDFFSLLYADKQISNVCSTKALSYPVMLYKTPQRYYELTKCLLLEAITRKQDKMVDFLLEIGYPLHNDHETTSTGGLHYEEDDDITALFFHNSYNCLEIIANKMRFTAFEYLYKPLEHILTRFNKKHFELFAQHFINKLKEEELKELNNDFDFKCLIAIATNDTEWFAQITSNKVKTWLVTTKLQENYRYLHLASFWGSTKMIELLLSYGCSPSAQSDNGFTALHQALENDRFDIALFFINKDYTAKNCDIHSGDSREPDSQLRPLHMAVTKNNKELVVALVKNGSVIEHEDDKQTPLELAEELGYQEIAEYLHTQKNKLNNQNS